jgi:hypothetical protein
MPNAKKYLCVIALLCALTISLSFRLWAECEVEKPVSNQQHDKSMQEQMPTQNQPKISFDYFNYDAGEVYEGENVIHTFTVKNTGTAQLEIERVNTG